MRGALVLLPPASRRWWATPLAVSLLLVAACPLATALVTLLRRLACQPQ